MGEGPLKQSPDRAPGFEIHGSATGHCVLLVMAFDKMVYAPNETH